METFSFNINDENTGMLEFTDLQDHTEARLMLFH